MKKIKSKSASRTPGVSTIDFPSPIFAAGAVPAVIDTRPLRRPARPRTIRRNGRVASLPRLQRDMVNHMLWNAVPYKNIVAALDEEGFTVTERNVSNWATGGYLEWRLEQEHVLQNRLDQDQLVDFLRRDDAAELPEVGLQAAATRLSQILLQKLARAEDPEAHLDNFSTLVDLLCRLNRELAASQQERDESRRSLGPPYDPANVKEQELVSCIRHERYYSDPPRGSKLPKPPVPPALPPLPTASRLADEDRLERYQARMERAKALLEVLQPKATPEPTTHAQKPAAAAGQAQSPSETSDSDTTEST
jgi:hypothetical protein